MLDFVVEFLGTFIFLSVIIATGKPALIAMAPLLVILLGAGISGAHFNPAVSLMFWANGALSNANLAGYIVAQMLGGLGAIAVYNLLSKKAF